MNRHQKRAGEAFLRKHPNIAHQMTQLEMSRHSQFIESNIQTILKTEAPIRFRIANKLKSHFVSKLLGIRFTVKDGDFGVYVGNKKVGEFKS